MLTVFRRPAREAVQETKVEVLCDLDAILGRSMAFRFDGVDHRLKDVTVAEHYRFTQAWQDFQSEPPATHEAMVERVVALFEPICPSATRAVVSKMSVRQIASLFAFIVDVLHGRAGAVDQVIEKKKITG